MNNNAITNLIGNRDAIRKIMAMDANGKMDSIVENARQEGRFSSSEGGFTYNGELGSKQVDSGEVTINEQVITKHPKMPKQIIESFKKNPGRKAGSSVLDSIPEDMLKKMKPVVNESSQAQPAPSQGSGIDYSLIKTIINEAVQENVKKYMSAMSRKLINEGIGGNNQLMCMKLGNTFSFIDQNGNIYEAELKFKKKMND